MFGLSPAALGISLILLGLVFTLLTLLFLRLNPRMPSAPQSPNKSSQSLIDPHDEAILVIESGGRVSYLNPLARELFSSWEPQVNLENLARRTRPSEHFLALCAGEGRSRLTLNGRFIEGSSYSIPARFSGEGSVNTVLVSLRRPGLVLKDPDLAGEQKPGDKTHVDASAEPGISGQTFGFFTELTRAMAASLDLETTLQTILESIDRLFPCDLLEISIWDKETACLTPYRLVALSDLNHRLEKISARGRQNQGYSDCLIADRKLLLVSDTTDFRRVQPAGDLRQFPYRSYLGVPLLIAGDLVGTLELASLTTNSFSQDDIEVVHLLAGQAAVAVNNALLYRQEQQRSVEMGGLADLAQSVQSLRDPQDLYNRLIESISPLLAVEVLGFLIYDENRSLLEGQEPFLGLQGPAVQWCRAAIKPGSPAEAVWRSGEAIVTTNAPDDPRLQALELHHLALAAGFYHTILIPLTSSGRMLGYLMAANKRDGSPFDSNDQRILTIIAGQAAPIIDNAELMQQSRRRAQRAETLRRIASLTSSAATLDEILKFSVQDLARLLQADAAALFLLDEAIGELRLNRVSAFGIDPNVTVGLVRVSTQDPQFSRLACGSRQPINWSIIDHQQSFAPFYNSLAEIMDLQSAISAPLLIRDQALGELLIGSCRPSYFTDGDLQTITTAAGQLAVAIDRSALSSQTDQSLRRRVGQLVALTRVSRELSTTLKLNDLLERVYAEALQTTRADCGVILLFEPASGDSQTPPQIRFHVGDPATDILHPLERLVQQTGETILIDEFTQEHVRIAAAEPSRMKSSLGSLTQAGSAMDQVCVPAHADVRSAMVTPIIYQSQVAGLIHLHSSEAAHFGSAEREVAEALAIQAAIALGNAERYQEQRDRADELNRRVEAFARILEVFQELRVEGSNAETLDNTLETIAYALQATTPFEIVAISVHEPQTNALSRLIGAGVPLSVLEKRRSCPLTWTQVQAVLQPQERDEQVFCIPVNRAGELHFKLEEAHADTDPAAGVYTGSQLNMIVKPMYASTGEPLGIISLESRNPDASIDRIGIETLEIFSCQAALLIESYLKVSSLRTALGRVHTDLEFANQAAENARERLPALLHKDLEQTLAIRELSLRAQRIRSGLEITDIISRQTSITDVLEVLGREILTRMDFDLVLFAENVSGEPNLTSEIGSIPDGVHPQALLGQRNPLRHTIQTGEMILAAGLADRQDWLNSPLLRALNACSFICIPIYGTQSKVSAGSSTDNGMNGSRTAGGQPSAVLLAVQLSPQSDYTDEDRQLFDLLARQISISLQNLNLQETTSHRLNEVRLLLDFSRQIGSLDPVNILDTFVESALHLVPAAQMAMAALWDPREGVLIPQSALGYADEKELRLIRYQPDEGIPGMIYRRGQVLNLEVVDFTCHYNLSPSNLLAYRNATAGRLPVSCLAVPIQTGSGGNTGTDDAQIQEVRRHPLGILVLDSTTTTSAFSESDQAVIASLAQQTALTLENARLYQASRQRSTQLQALTSAAASVSSTLKSEELTGVLLSQIKNILPFDTGTLWLRLKDEARNEKAPQSKHQSERMVIRAALGFADRDERLGLTVEVDDSLLLKEMTRTGLPILVQDVRRDERFASPALVDIGQNEALAFFKHLSWLGLPLIATGKVIGVIALEKTEANAYTSDEVQLATTFVGQAAAALENAELYEESVQRALELDRRTQILSILNRLSYELSGTLDADHILDYAAQEFMAILQVSSASALRVAPAPEGIPNQLILQAEYPQFSDPSFFHGMALPAAELFERLSLSLGIFNTEDASAEPELSSLQPFLARHQTQSLLIVPVVSAAGSGMSEQKLHGFLLAHDSRPVRFSNESVELARTISNQVAIAFQNALLLQETLDLTNDLEQRIQMRTAELAHERQRAETLVRIISELSASLDLDQVLHRTLEVLSEFVDAPQITILIARPGERKLKRLASIGYTAPPALHGSPTPFDMDQGLAGWVILERRPALVKDVLTDPRWIPVEYPRDPQRPTYQHRSAMGVPLMSGAESLGCLMLYHPTVDHFTSDQLDLVQAAANQVAVAINNAELYRLIRDQAEDLGNMLRNQQVETSRSKAILEAVADGVLVTDFNRVITLFNASAEKILGLDRSQVLGQTMEHFSGLFGRATRQWMDVVETWTEAPGAYNQDDTFAEQFILEDGRVIDVRLAPVLFRSDFMGTVSIFQDITHRVEVDRLKSEFVATVSHELRTPMTSIKGYIEILLMGAAGVLSPQQTDFLQVVKFNADRLSVLVNDLLDVSQIESGQLSLNLVPLNMADLVSQAVDDLKRRNAGDMKGIQVEKTAASSLPPVLGDPERIRRILENLLDNAFQYNLPDGRIRVHLQKAGDSVQVDISDSGVGIHPEDHDRVFDRFYRGDSTLTLGVAGTGLGLSIVRNLVQMHNGRIWLESTGIPGEGSTFAFTLPVYTPNASEIA